jgi:hypothetical protein
MPDGLDRAERERESMGDNACSCQLCAKLVILKDNPAHMSFDVAPVIAVFFLVVVGAALLCAGIYALFGKPSSHEGEERRRHVVNGFRLGGGILLGFVLVGTFVAAIGVGLFGNPARFSSKPLAFVLAAISLTLISVMVQRWAEYLGGWIGYGALNGLLMVSSGHLVNNPAIPVRRSLALMMTGVAILSALVCLRFTEDYKLNVVDKIALVGWVVFFAIAANVEKYGLPAMILGCLGLVFAWLYHRLLNRPVRHRRAQSPYRNAV